MERKDDGAVEPEDRRQQRQCLGVFLPLHLPERVREAARPQARVTAAQRCGVLSEADPRGEGQRAWPHYSSVPESTQADAVELRGAVAGDVGKGISF